MILQGSHGFMTTHRWRDTIGAFVDVEASGTGGTGKILVPSLFSNLKCFEVFHLHQRLCAMHLTSFF